MGVILKSVVHDGETWLIQQLSRNRWSARCDWLDTTVRAESEELLMREIQEISEALLV